MSFNRDILENSMGYSGFEYISGITNHIPPSGQIFCAIQTISATVIASINTESGSSITGDTFTGETIPSGIIIPGRFTSITLTSGKCIVYKGV